MVDPELATLMDNILNLSIKPLCLHLSNFLNSPKHFDPLSPSVAEVLGMAMSVEFSDFVVRESLFDQMTLWYRPQW